ncbi:hypothetical protein DNTS_012005 [Danionella cerebrum]|uniref:Lymphoid-restricted membrane protein n=1 Tax=Danionella cerebrum TaxID=2873325 RepID=A0A553N3U6_9TELE|nr:hypothetical protein DNTS_012005 [Danionella translucida]TRY60098.1 hypothetical protein DNTS_012005 [Danionella translucida]TRY60099.1 hypothetical protein DNTS_012005 [Danionella translucida]
MKLHRSPVAKVMACEDQVPNQTETSENESENGDGSEDPSAFEELSAMDRLCSESVADLTEEELETAFSRLCLAFHCDHHTLCQRLEMEEHARNNAEDNLKLEVERGMEVLETLKGMCYDMKRAVLLQRLELCLNIIAGTVGRISNTSEVLGSVHQEAKVNRAVELMVTHVENLNRRHERSLAELEELKKQMDRSTRERYFCEERVRGSIVTTESQYNSNFKEAKIKGIGNYSPFHEQRGRSEERLKHPKTWVYRRQSSSGQRG